MHENQVVIITGASSGIGRSLAFTFGAQGAQVVITGRNKEKLDETALALQAAGISNFPYVCDSSSESQTREMVAAVVATYGKIDLLINNAGISMRSMFETVDLNVLKQVMEINFWGTVYATHAALPYLKNLEVVSSVFHPLRAIGVCQFERVIRLRNLP